MALRTARDQHLQHFGKIGTGDVLLLVQEIDAEKEREREREREKEKAQKMDESGSSANAAMADKSMADVTSNTGAPPDGEGDVGMEDR